MTFKGNLVEFFRKYTDKKINTNPNKHSRLSIVFLGCCIIVVSVFCFVCFVFLFCFLLYGWIIFCYSGHTSHGFVFVFLQFSVDDALEVHGIFWFHVLFFKISCFSSSFFSLFLLYARTVIGYSQNVIVTWPNQPPDSFFAPKVTSGNTKNQSLLAIIIWQLNESWLELVLQEEKIVRGSNCDDIFCRMPCSVEDFFVEI